MRSNSPLSRDTSVAFLASVVYFVQGALSISGVAFPLFLRGRGWGISEIATFSFLVGLPWTLKIVYGLLSDGVPIQGLRRKPYLVFASFLSFSSWIGLAFFPHLKGFLYGFAVTANLGFALTDVVTDALIVEHSTESSTSFYQSLAWGFRSLGAVLGGALGGWLAGNVPFHIICGITAALPLTTLFACTWIHESPQRGRGGGFPFLNLLVRSLRELFGGELKWFSLLLLTFSFSASFSTPFFFFLKEKLVFSEMFLGSLSSLTWCGAMGGCFAYAQLFKKISLKQALGWAIGLNLLNILSTYFVLGPLSAGLLSFLGGVLSYLSLLPLMAGAAFLSRRQGREGSLFALLMSVYNLGQLISTFIGGKLFDIMGLNLLIVFSATVGGIGFFFVSRILFLNQEAT